MKYYGIVLALTFAGIVFVWGAAEWIDSISKPAEPVKVKRTYA